MVLAAPLAVPVLRMAGAKRWVAVRGAQLIKLGW